MKTQTKIDRLIKLRDEILKEAEKWNKAEKWRTEKCPLDMYAGLKNSHNHLSKLFTGMGMYGWRCPFCGKEEQD